MTVLRKPVVPALFNMTLQQIEEQDYPFEIVEVEGQFSDEIEKGHVILQSIVPGEKAAKNTAIEVVVSLGKGIAFPDLTGKSEEEVQMILKDAGFVYLQGEREVSEEIEAGYVIYCETLDGKVISAGDMVEENAQIVVIYSFGAGQVEVPDVEGDSLEDAQEKLTNSNLKYKVKKVYHNSVQKGKVVSQNIGAGQFVEAGTEIELTISLGKKNTYTPSTSKPKTETQTPEEGSGETENVEGEVPEGEGTETPGDSVVSETPSTEIPESDAGQDAPVVESTDPQVPETSGEESQ